MIGIVKGDGMQSKYPPSRSRTCRGAGSKFPRVEQNSNFSGSDRKIFGQDHNFSGSDMKNLGKVRVLGD